jgi:hypothetical protein
MSTDLTRYYFNIVKSHETVHDLEGSELLSLEDARAHAIEDARVLMSMAVLQGFDISSRTIEIIDDRGDVVLTVPFRDALTAEAEH